MIGLSEECFIDAWIGKIMQRLEIPYFVSCYIKSKILSIFPSVVLFGVRPTKA